MALQVPQLQRFQPQEASTIGRTETAVPQQAEAIAMQTKAATGLISEVADYQAKVEEHAIEQQASKFASDYEISRKVGLQKIKEIQGDPTPLYTDWENSGKDAQEKIFTDNPDLDPKLQQAIREKTTKIEYFLRDNAAVAHEVQRSKYNTEEAKRTSDLIKDRILDSAQFISNEPASLGKVQEQVNELKSHWLKWGEAEGYVTVKDGKQNISPVLIAQMKKETSDGLKNIVTTLSNDGKTDQAKQVLELFKDDFTADDTVKLNKHNTESEIDKAAWNNVFDAMKKYPNNPTMQRKALESLPTEIRAKAESHLSTRNERLKKERDLNSELALERGTKMFAKDEFISVDEMRSDPRYKNIISKMSDKDRKALEQHYFEPDVSSSSAMMEFTEALHNDTLVDWTPAKVLKVKSQLNRSDRALVDKTWNDLKTETNSEKREMVKSTTKMLAQELGLAKLVRVDAKGKGVDRKNQDKLLEIQNEWIQLTGDWKMGDTPDERLRNVQKFVASKKANEPFPGSDQGKRRFESAPVEKPKASPSAERPLTQQEKQEWIKKFIQLKKDGRRFDPAKDMDALKKFIQSGGKD